MVDVDRAAYRQTYRQYGGNLEALVVAWSHRLRCFAAVVC